MTDYSLTATGEVIRTADNATIPLDPANADRQTYQAWVEAGNVAAPFVPPVTVPSSISDRQFFQQLAVLGIITQTEALSAVTVGQIPPELQTLVNSLPSDQQFAATMLISGATAFDRYHPLTVEIGTAYGWTSAQTDAFFIAASAL